MSRYEQICKLINEEIDEIISDTDIKHDLSESSRDEVIEHYIDFLKKDLQSDDA